MPTYYNDQNNRQSNNRQSNSYRQYNGSRRYENNRQYENSRQYAPNDSGRRSSITPNIVIVALAAAVVAIVLICYLSCSDSKPQLPSPPQISTPTTNNGPATVRVTFPEGLNVLQFGERLEKNNVCSASDFYDTMNSVDFSADFSFLPSFDELSDRTYKLEGYLFPDTYDFYVGESAESVIRRFLKRFGQVITPELMAQAANVGEFYGTSFTFDDVLIMASIVEREINVPDEMDGVAAVFFNRIKYPSGTVDGSATGGYFQSDATKFYPYIFGTAPEGFVSEYNTFNVKGLPKGPICCPSLDAIKGTLNPDHDQNAFFFYTDINKHVYYAVTFSEHQKNYRYCVDNGLAP